MKSHVRTAHHIVSQDFGGTSRPNNIILLREKMHQGIHQVFDSGPPVQQIRKCLEIGKSAMSPEVYSILSNTLKRFEGIMELQAYEPDCVNADRFIHRLNNPHY